MRAKIKPDERVQHVAVIGDMLHLFLFDQRRLLLPLNWFPRLEQATTEQRRNWQLLSGGFAIRWPDIDEDLEITGLLAGNAAPERRATVKPDPQRIREYRKELGVSQTELAEQLGVRQATVSDWEKGKIAPSPLAASKLSELLAKMELYNESKDAPSVIENDAALSLGTLRAPMFLYNIELKATDGHGVTCKQCGSEEPGVRRLGGYCFMDLPEAEANEFAQLGRKPEQRFNPIPAFNNSWAKRVRA